jgi:pseudouridine-5'-phosphate glycosidase
VDAPGEAAALLRAHWALQGAGVVLAQPAQTDVLLESTELEDALDQAENEAVSAGIRGKELTPFLLSRLHQVTEGKTLLINKALVAANARLAAQVASKLLDF